ncbi:hypothetical protein B0H14DRAFT_2691567 [Mycena olivaceomarginata]|nr:hypothetical protein B0H14DRAFT_2691567 [Mycena olivaceomarginata]
MYDGKRVSAVSPAFADVRKIRDRIAAHRKVEFPAGTGFSGVQHYMQTKDRALPVSERYIHAAMSKGGFKQVVTLHPQLAKFIQFSIVIARQNPPLSSSLSSCLMPSIARRRQSVDENDIVEGIRQRTQSKRARGEA